VPLLVLGAVALFIMRRRKQGKGSQPPPRPPVQEMAEHYKTQPASPALRPTSDGALYNPYVRSPFFPFHSFRVGDLPLRWFVIQNPGDPTTFPPQVADGHSSMTYLNPLSPHAQGQGQGQGRYSGAPEI
jgi:hypothetical protein